MFCVRCAFVVFPANVSCSVVFQFLAILIHIGVSVLVTDILFVLVFHWVILLMVFSMFVSVIVMDVMNSIGMCGEWVLCCYTMFACIILSETAIFLVVFGVLMDVACFSQCTFRDVHVVDSVYWVCSVHGVVRVICYVECCVITVLSVLLVFCGSCFYCSSFQSCLCMSSLWILVCFVLSLSFVVIQLFELSVSVLISSFSIMLSVSCSLECLHCWHVMLGCFVFVCSFSISFCGFHTLNLTVFAMLYWHFVDVVWFSLVRFVYCSF